MTVQTYIWIALFAFFIFCWFLTFMNSGFFPSWTDTTCFSNWWGWSKFESYFLHSNLTRLVTLAHFLSWKFLVVLITFAFWPFLGWSFFGSGSKVDPWFVSGCLVSLKKAVEHGCFALKTSWVFEELMKTNWEKLNKLEINAVRFLH